MAMENLGNVSKMLNSMKSQNEQIGKEKKELE